MYKPNNAIRNQEGIIEKFRGVEISRRKDPHPFRCCRTMIYHALINKKYFGVAATGTTPSQQLWGLGLVDAINNIRENRVVVTGPNEHKKVDMIRNIYNDNLL